MGEAFPDPAKEAAKKKQRDERLKEQHKRPLWQSPHMQDRWKEREKGEAPKGDQQPPTIH